MAALQRSFREQPIVPLLVLLGLLVVLLFTIQPGLLGRPQAVGHRDHPLRDPLAILAACQTLTMLTGGIDLSVATVASVAGFVMASQSPSPGAIAGHPARLLRGRLLRSREWHRGGHLPGPALIMTIGTGLVAAGLLVVYQRFVITAGSRVPRPHHVARGRHLIGLLPQLLLVLAPLATVIIFSLRRTGYGRLLYAVGDNPVASRLAGVVSGRCCSASNVISSLLAGLAGIMVAGVT